MIAYLRGRPVSASEETVIINVQGVGYEVHCSKNTLHDFSVQDVVEAYVYTHVREDALTLFGFSSSVEKQLFLSLIKVNGIGPKMAVAILSADSVENIVSLINDGDAKGLAKLPRVGKKTAEQIVLSLKGKLVRGHESSSSKKFPAREEIVSALVHLGFRVADVEKVVNQMDVSVDLQTGVREGLVALTN